MILGKKKIKLQMLLGVSCLTGFCLLPCVVKGVDNLLKIGQTYTFTCTAAPLAPFGVTSLDTIVTSSDENVAVCDGSMTINQNGGSVSVEAMGTGSCSIDATTTNGSNVLSWSVQVVGVTVDVRDEYSEEPLVGAGMGGCAIRREESDGHIRVSVTPADLDFSVYVGGNEVANGCGSAIYSANAGSYDVAVHVGSLVFSHAVEVACRVVTEEQQCCSIPACGEPVLSPGCARFDVSLGALQEGVSIGVLTFTANTAPFTVSPKMLRAILSDDDRIVSHYNTENVLTNVAVVGVVNADITSISNGLQIDIDEFGKPPLRIEVVNPGPGPDTSQIQMKRYRGDVLDRESLAEWNDESQDWKFVDGGSEAVRTQSRSVDGNFKYVTNTTTDFVGNLLSKQVDIYQFIGSTDRLVTQQVYCAEDGFLETRKEWNSKGWPLLSVEANGRWQAGRQYDCVGCETSCVSSWLDTSLTTDGANARERLVSYDPLTAIGDDGAVLQNQSRCRLEKIKGVVVSKTYTLCATNVEETLITKTTERVLSPQQDSGFATTEFGAIGNQRTVHTYFLDSDDCCDPLGRIRSVLYSDGRMDFYDYTEYDGGRSVRTTVSHGVADPANGEFLLVEGISTIDISLTTNVTQTLWTERWIYLEGGSSARVDRTSFQYDTVGNQVAQYYANGTHSTNMIDDLGRTYWRRDAQGKQSGVNYSSDARQSRPVSSVVYGADGQADIVSSNAYDVIGRVIASHTMADGLERVTRRAYDLAGRVTNSVDVLGIATAYDYENGGRIQRTVRGGITNTSVNFLDGRLHYTEQNGVRKQTYDYGVNADGSQWSKIYTGPDGTNSPVWTQTTTDALGRSIREERPGFGGVILTNQQFYNAKGQLTTNITAGAASVFYCYDVMGKQIATCVDLNANGLWDNESDQITSNSTHYVMYQNECWQESVNVTIGSQPTITRRRLTGLTTACTDETITIDGFGRTNRVWSSIDIETATLIRSQDLWDSVNDVQSVSVGGVLQYTVSKTGERTDYGYDAFQRRIRVTDARTGTAQTHYNVLGQVSSVEDSMSNRTSYAYDALGRRISVTNTLGEATHYAYSPEGQLLATWGNTYPVAYAYDAYDRMSTMYTLRDTNVAITGYSDFESHISDFDFTSWLYDEPTGLLTNKLYDDNQGPSYTYTADGKLQTRQWARGALTTYAYDTCSGALTNISYGQSLVDVPVSFTYNRLGQQETITDAQGTRTFTYNDQLQLAAETNTLATITRSYDPLGRSSGFSVASGAQPVDYAVTYTYSDVGRFHSISSSVSSVSSVVNYSYLDGSDLVSGYTLNQPGTQNPEFKTVRTFELKRNLITGVQNGVENRWSSRYRYSNDELGRRTMRLQYNDDNNSGEAATYSYNARGELTNATHQTLVDSQQSDYAYQYDPIGNRESASQTTNNNQRTTLYLSNPLNQYTNILASGISPESPTYDADGNMLTYNGWTFTWNGENRLINASNSTHTISYSYDYMGRRFSKVVDDGSTVTTNQFTYDGWNLIAESDGTTTNHYVWGLDLSGSMQGAGGIGGLLATVRDGETYFSCFDANGNLTDYVDDTGSNVAHYVYGPFGGTISSTGDKKDDFRFRFSTKYLDDETALYYYGYRYYNPQLGRWVNRDPIGEYGGVNVYAFVKNTPIFSSDILGWIQGCCQDECFEGFRHNFSLKTAVLGPVNPITEDLLDVAQLFAGLFGSIPTGASPSELISWLLQQGFPSGQILSTYVNLIVNGLPWDLYVVFEVDICEERSCLLFWTKTEEVTRTGTHRCTTGGNLPGGSWFPGTDLIDDVSDSTLQQCINEAEIAVLGGGGTLWP